MSNISPLYAHEYAGETRLWPEPDHCISIVSRLNRNPHKDVVAGGCGRDAGEASGQPGHRTPQRGHSLVSVWPECGHRERETRGPGPGTRVANVWPGRTLCGAVVVMLSGRPELAGRDQRSLLSPPDLRQEGLWPVAVRTAQNVPVHYEKTGNSSGTHGQTGVRNAD